MASVGCEDLTLQEQTDVESLDGTLASLNDSSITRLPHSSSETEFETDENTVEQLVDEFCSKAGSELPIKSKDVAKWLKNSADDSQIVVAPEDFQQNFATVDIEKMAAMLKDSAKNKTFSPNDWIEVEQQVPSFQTFQCNVLNEVKERPVLTLMYCIESYCNGENDSFHMELLQSACPNATASGSHNSALDRSKHRTEILKTFNQGTFFSELSLGFKRLPKTKRPLVKAVERFVTSEIKKAEEKNNPVLFTRYAAIPDEVKKCNDDKRLGFGPDKLAKCGIVLQRAVYQDMIGRCLEFLKHVGFDMFPEEDNNDDARLTLNLSSNESGLSQQFSSQGSQNESDVPSPFSSQTSNMVEDIEIGNEYPFVPMNGELNEAAFDDPNNQRLLGQNDVEILRGHVHVADNSPGGSQLSQQSYNSYDTSSPQYSLPEQERQPVGSMEIDNINHAQDLVDMEEYVIINLEELQEHNRYAEELAGNLDEDGEPQPRRRRLE